MSDSPVQIRQAVHADLEGILALEQAIEHTPHWSPKTYAEIIRRTHEPLHQPRRDDAADFGHAAVDFGPGRCLFVGLLDRSSSRSVPRTELVGFAVGKVICTPRAPGSPKTIALPAELETVAGASNSRRSGIGRALCLAVIAWCREAGASSIELEVRARSSGAIALYSGLGFAETGKRARYYQEPDDDAVLMHLSLA